MQDELARRDVCGPMHWVAKKLERRERERERERCSSSSCLGPVSHGQPAGRKEVSVA